MVCIWYQKWAVYASVKSNNYVFFLYLIILYLDVALKIFTQHFID